MNIKLKLDVNIYNINKFNFIKFNKIFIFFYLSFLVNYLDWFYFLTLNETLTFVNAKILFTIKTFYLLFINKKKLLEKKIKTIIHIIILLLL